MEFPFVDEIRKKGSNVDSRIAFLEFTVTWDINSLVRVVFDWISNSEDSDISMVGVFSSHHFLQLVGSLLDSTLALNFRRLIYSTSLAHVYWSGLHHDHSLTLQDLHHVSYLAGCDLIDTLDIFLSPQSLAESYIQRIQALFLLVFGTILAIGYSSRLTDSPPFPNDRNDSVTTDWTLWDVMQEHLSQMLGHHLVFLGSRIDFRFQPSVEKRLLTMAVSKWLPEGSFTWTTRSMAGDVSTTIEEEVQPALDSCHCGRLRRFPEGKLVPANSMCHIIMTNIVYDDCHPVLRERNCTTGESPLIVQPAGKDILTATGISELNLKPPRLAYLSACSIAGSRKEQLWDEGLHLLSEFVPTHCSKNRTKLLV